MTALGVGKDIKSMCGKCKDVRWHTIVSMFDSKTIAKVQCNSCKSEHKYKDPTAKPKRRSTTTKKSKKTMPVSELWLQEMGNVSTKSREYSIREKFVAGDVIDHKVFGAGIVQDVKDDRIEVLFKEFIKELVHNK